MAEPSSQPTSSNSTLSQPAAPFTVFHAFSDLPKELQVQVWKLASKESLHNALCYHFRFDVAWEQPYATSPQHPAFRPSSAPPPPPPTLTACFQAEPSAILGSKTLRALLATCCDSQEEVLKFPGWAFLDLKYLCRAPDGTESVKEASVPFPKEAVFWVEDTTRVIVKASKYRRIDGRDLPLPPPRTVGDILDGLTGLDFAHLIRRLGFVLPPDYISRMGFYHGTLPSEDEFPDYRNTASPDHVPLGFAHLFPDLRHIAAAKRMGEREQRREGRDTCLENTISIRVLNSKQLSFIEAALRRLELWRTYFDMAKDP